MTCVKVKFNCADSTDACAARTLADRLIFVRERRIEILLGDDSRLPESVLSGKIRVLELLICLGLPLLGFGLIQRRLVRPWIDHKQKISFVHDDRLL